MHRAGWRRLMAMLHRRGSVTDDDENHLLPLHLPFCAYPHSPSRNRFLLRKYTYLQVEPMMIGEEDGRMEHNLLSNTTLAIIKSKILVIALKLFRGIIPGKKTIAVFTFFNILRVKIKEIVYVLKSQYFQDFPKSQEYKLG